MIEVAKSTYWQTVDNSCLMIKWKDIFLYVSHQNQIIEVPRNTGVQVVLRGISDFVNGFENLQFENVDYVLKTFCEGENFTVKHAPVQLMSRKDKQAKFISIEKRTTVDISLIRNDELVVDCNVLDSTSFPECIVKIILSFSRNILLQKIVILKPVD